MKLFFSAIIFATICFNAPAIEPDIRLAMPEDGTVFAVGETILLRAEPRDAAVATFQKVEFVTGTLIGEVTAAPFEYSWQDAPAGIHSIIVRATTATGRIESWKSTIAVLPRLDQGQALHVDKNYLGAASTGSATAPFKGIQDAINAAVNGDTIKVAAGEYRETIAIREKNLNLLGGYAGASSAIYSQGGAGDFSSRVPHSTQLLGQGADPVIDVDFNGGTQWCVIEGFTISGGKRGLHAGTYEDPTGKYFFLINNSITANTNTTDAVAGVAISQISTGVLSNSISGNRALGYAGLFVDGNAKTAGLVKGNLVEGNFSTEDYGHAAGIAFRGRGASGTVTRNIVRNNRAFYGAGIFVDGDNGSNFTRVSFNKVLRNRGFFGTGEFVDGGATAIVENEIIAWNEAIDGQFGGAFAIDSGPATHATLINCTVAYNASYYDEYSGGNGLVITEDDGGDRVSVEVKNSIFWHNSMLPGGKEINAPGNGVLTIDYSDIEQTIASGPHLQLGSGIIRDDPLFADPQNDDFHVRSKSGRWSPSGDWVTDTLNSPCLDAGDPTSLFQNETSPNGARINLGAWGNTPEASRTGATNLNSIRITQIRLVPGGARELSVTGPAGRYQLQSSISLAPATWADLAVITNSAGTITCEDPATLISPQRFYRIRALE